jgi:hypothetical protein
MLHVAWLLAVDRGQSEFIPAEEYRSAAATQQGPGEIAGSPLANVSNAYLTSVGIPQGHRGSLASHAGAALGAPHSEFVRG